MNEEHPDEHPSVRRSSLCRNYVGCYFVFPPTASWATVPTTIGILQRAADYVQCATEDSFGSTSHVLF